MVKLIGDPSKNPSKWVNAPEFIPGSMFHGDKSPSTINNYNDDIEEEEEYFFSYSAVAMTGLNVLDNMTSDEASNLLCPFYEMTGACPWNDKCEYLHGLECEMCFKHCLHPHDMNQQKEHRRQCISNHENEMEKAFAVQRSEGQTCGICMEVVVDRLIWSERRFGILSGCDHCFCLSCIRKWRNSLHTSKKIIRACPICREISYLVIPSEVWITDQEDKDKLLALYKSNLCAKPCKYFDEGRGTCPFNDSCLYQHAFPDGTIFKAAPRLLTDQEGLSKKVNNATLWDFMAEREERVWEHSVESWSEDND
jgi:E3 ubiquitin-protein ligase makorin